MRTTFCPIQRPVNGPIRLIQLFQTGRQLLYAAQCAGFHAGQRPEQQRRRAFLQEIENEVILERTRRHQRHGVYVRLGQFSPGGRCFFGPVGRAQLNDLAAGGLQQPGQIDGRLRRRSAPTSSGLHSEATPTRGIKALFSIDIGLPPLAVGRVFQLAQ